ncbi:MAG: T9SS type A sorting domain-containing protein, partial [Bacteroidota bacterium]|nr:T9SS type A sorting domain-containing protein [Bacteroidota bacterium]
EWKSGAGNSQSVSIDLGKTITVNKVVLNWGRVYGTRFYLILSSDSGVANTIYGTDAGDGGIDEIVGLSGNGRYLKLFCLKNNSVDLPYELNEFEVYGTQGVSFIGNGIDVMSLSRYVLEQNYPNPFNPSTVINYQLPADGYVTLKVYDVLGREVTSLVNARMTSGTHSVKFDGSKFANGFYFYCLSSGGNVMTKKMLMVK